MNRPSTAIVQAWTGLIKDACQQDVHTKAFTGKGAGQRRVRQAQIDVDNIHLRLRQLSEATRGIHGRLFYLALHHRISTGQVSVRWRKAGCARSTHLAWSDMDLLFQKMPSVLAEWYREVDRLARRLNREEQSTRVLLGQAKAELEEEQRQR